jgi:gamma-glutamyltranspeptidase
VKPAVVSPHPVATEAGLALLERGASAAEATVAVAAVLSVVWPHMTGLGGDAFFVVFDKGEVRVLNASGFSGANVVVPDKIPDRGPGAVLTIPGAVAGWRALLGDRPLDSELLDVAIRLAEEGAVITPSVRRWMRPENESAWRALMSRSDGVRFFQPELAHTLRLLAGGADFYRSEISSRLCETFREWGVPLTEEDFDFQRAEWFEPLHLSFRGYDIWTTPPNSQGFATLRLLEAADACWPCDDFRERMVTATRKVFARRNAMLCDPAFHKGDTVAFSAVDSSGRGVSAIQSIYHDWGSGMWCPRTGILLQNRGVAFSLDPSHPNALAPRKRPAHTLSPALVTRGDSLAVLIGSMGGDGQPQTLCQVLTRILAAGESALTAVSAPRWLWGRTWGAATEELFCENNGSDHDMFGHCNVIDLRSGDTVAVTDWRAG